MVSIAVNKSNDMNKLVPMSVTVETITPTLALEYLESMSKNRRVRQSRVDRLANDMEEGAWIAEASGPIRFNTKGRVIPQKLCAGTPSSATPNA